MRDHIHVHKVWVCVKAHNRKIVCLCLKLKLASDLTSDAFVSASRRFIARHGKPKVIWSDHSSYHDAKNDLKELEQCLNEQIVQNHISEFCTTQHIE